MNWQELAPPHILKLPIAKNGLPIPWFVAEIKGEPDFRAADGEKFMLAIKEKRCWVCGEKLGGYLAFLIGPMCCINRVSGDPPSHRDCAIFSAKVCPFLANPSMVRREKDHPKKTAGAQSPGGIMIERNPGVSLLWITRSYQLRRDGKGGLVFRIGSAIETAWFREGRTATRDEVMESIGSGLPILHQYAAEEGPTAIDALQAMVADGLKHVPVA